MKYPNEGGLALRCTRPSQSWKVRSLSMSVQAAYDSLRWFSRGLEVGYRSVGTPPFHSLVGSPSMHRFYCPLPSPRGYLDLLRHNLFKNICLPGRVAGPAAQCHITAGYPIAHGLSWIQLWAHMCLRPGEAFRLALLGAVCHTWLTSAGCA